MEAPAEAAKEAEAADWGWEAAEEAAEEAARRWVGWGLEAADEAVRRWVAMEPAEVPSAQEAHGLQ